MELVIENGKSYVAMDRYSMSSISGLGDSTSVHDLSDESPLPQRVSTPEDSGTPEFPADAFRLTLRALLSDAEDFKNRSPSSVYFSQGIL